LDIRFLCGEHFGSVAQLLFPLRNLVPGHRGMKRKQAANFFSRKTQPLAPLDEAQMLEVGWQIAAVAAGSARRSAKQATTLVVTNVPGEFAGAHSWKH
jgi:hypothetical protein